MTEPELTPAQNEAVRRLLSDARHDQPLPDDVAARMDDVLAGLARERAGGSPAETADGSRADDTGGARAGVAAGPVVVPLAERREQAQRRRWPAVLLSAAAVAAIAFGVTQMLPGSTDNDGAQAPDVQSNSAEGHANGDSAPDMSASEGPPRATPSEDAGRSPLASGPMPRAMDLKEAEAELRVELGNVELRAGKAYKSEVTDNSSSLRIRNCGPTPPVPDSWLQPATYRGRDALVVFHSPTSSGRTVDLYTCGTGGGRFVDSVTLPAGE
ncbi:hypothetical protein [Nocardioides jensenii]|uniref:hypothetical protein n=1 Tax=Nocardioides jensenii TaxID=1843 RepID=UPI0008328B7A|nr:hypothetical protein [Nocardioides jensenii]